MSGTAASDLGAWLLILTAFGGERELLVLRALTLPAPPLAAVGQKSATGCWFRGREVWGLTGGGAGVSIRCFRA